MSKATKSKQSFATSKASFRVYSPECPARKITKVTDNIFIFATEKIIHPQKLQKQGN